MVPKRTQRDKILAYLKANKTLTVREAVEDLNIMSAPKRIQELRELGYPIAIDWVRTENGSRYGVYRLEEVTA